MTNDTLDKPVDLNYNQGSSFPPNAKMIGYGLIGVGTIFSILANWYLGPVILLFGLFICLTTYGTEFLPETKEIREYTKYLGFITISKKFSYEKWGYLSVVPKIVSSTVYGRSSNSTTLSDNFFTLSLIGKNYRSKKELVRFDNKNSAEDIAKRLSHRIGLDYFEYNPQSVREAFRK